MKISVFLFSFLAGFCYAGDANAPSQKDRNPATLIGTSHVAGKYHLTGKDFLNEGADAALSMGLKVIKVWFYGTQENPPKMYPFNSNWPQVDSLVDNAKTPYFKALFEKPFTTYVLVVTSFGRDQYYWINGITPQQQQDEEKQFYELTKYLLQTYAGTGKTFILQHHEGDWHLKDKPDPAAITPPQRFEYMIKWLKSRQAGVDKARAQFSAKDVNVFHAAEVVNVVKTMKDKQDNMVNKVLPFVDLDLISYSAYDSTVLGGVHRRSELKDAISFIAKNARKSRYFGNRNVFIGEFGIPENEFSPSDVNTLITNVLETGIDCRCPYIIFWQLYCNELKNNNLPVPVKDNNDVRGFWLIKPDGTKSAAWKILNRYSNAR